MIQTFWVGGLVSEGGSVVAGRWSPRVEAEEGLVGKGEEMAAMAGEGGVYIAEMVCGKKRRGW